jgi:aminobenzoyl-glutamate utilization protein B
MKQTIFKWVDNNKETLSDMASRIWAKAEGPFKETFASELQMSFLEKEGFQIKRDFEDMPTAFVAEYGDGYPILGILGEYDALPGLSQKVSNKREADIKDAPGHGCGHNLIGVGGIGAVLAIKEAMDKGVVSGTIRYYGCPAEETLAGKVFMAREGSFDDLDACLTWHPANLNTTWKMSSLAMNSVKFKFKGISAHAAAAPEMGRSALDAVELMNVGANYLREHVNEKARIHYSITNGGCEPNIVAPEAEVWYYIRAPKRVQVEEIFSRLVKVSQGAAMMTETEVEHKIISGCYEYLPNTKLGDILHKNMLELGAPLYTEEDKTFAKELVNTFPEGQIEKVMSGWYAPEEIYGMTLHKGVAECHGAGKALAGSTDVADVSWITPTGQLLAASWPMGVAAHTWQATAASGSGIGFAGMHFAAKALAGSLYDIFEDASMLDDIRVEFKEKTVNKQYTCALPDDVKPAH